MCLAYAIRDAAKSMFVDRAALDAAAHSDDCTAKTWRPTTKECMLTLAGHEGVKSAVFSADGASVVTARNDRTAAAFVGARDVGFDLSTFIVSMLEPSTVCHIDSISTGLEQTVEEPHNDLECEHYTRA